jgi:hypothetical protein
MALINGQRVEMIPGNEHESQSKGTQGTTRNVSGGSVCWVDWDCGHSNIYTEEHIRVVPITNRNAIYCLKKG